MIDKGYHGITVTRQCELLGLSRSTLYHKRKAESPEVLLLKRRIDEIYLNCPYFGSRKITAALNRQGIMVNRKRVQRLMRQMGIEAIYSRPKTTIKRVGHKVFPYLLKGLDINRPNQVWCADITYIPMVSGYLYLVAVMDWFSRYVLSWRLSNTLEASFCLEALEDALGLGQPEIFNTDQGSQFTCKEFVSALETREIKVSMDGRGRFYDNIFIERLWRSVKYEEAYLSEFSDGEEAQSRLEVYFKRYNNLRPHQSLRYQTPQEVHSICKQIPKTG